MSINPWLLIDNKKLLISKRHNWHWITFYLETDKKLITNYKVFFFYNISQPFLMKEYWEPSWSKKKIVTTTFALVFPSISCIKVLNSMNFKNLMKYIYLVQRARRCFGRASRCARFESLYCDENFLKIFWVG